MVTVRRTPGSMLAGLGAAALACGLIAGCADSKLTCDDLTGEASLVIGVAGADGRFVALADGAEIEAECRANGFWLLATSIRANGLMPGRDGRFGNPADPLILVEAYLGADLVGASSPEGQHVGLAQVGDAAVLHSVFVVLGGRRCNELPVDLLGQTVVLSAQVTDSCGNRATAEVEAVVVNEQSF